jgi:DNA segregation ATPase FtsK/SpoIIIE-like protein
MCSACSGGDREYRETIEADARARRRAGSTMELRQELQQVPVDDSYYAEAVAIVRASGQFRATELQRKLRIGYGRAVSLIERMRESGDIEVCSICRRPVNDPRGHAHETE